MRLNILISCYNESVNGVPAVFLSPRQDVRYVVSHQMSAEYAGRGLPVPQEFRQRDDVLYAPFIGRGLSGNRNHAMDALAGWSLRDDDICILADDDVRYRNEYFDTVLSTFVRHPELSVAAFRIRTPDGQPEFKKYPVEAFELKSIPLTGGYYLSSVEIAFRFHAVKGIRFDTDFGLGSDKWPEGGEEAVFLSDCLKRGLRMGYFPEDVVIHGYMSSGKGRKTVRKARMMLAVALRYRGPFSLEAVKGVLRVVWRRLSSPFRRDC